MPRGRFQSAEPSCNSSCRSRSLTLSPSVRLACEWSRDRMSRMCRRRMIYLRWTSLMQKPPVRFLPRWKLRSVLSPVHQRRLITPLQQLSHGRSMRGRQHERPHRNLRIPTRRRPECIPLIAQHRRRKIPFRALSLPHNSHRSKQESW